MGKVIKITEEFILVAEEDKSIAKIPVSAFEFTPTLNQKVEVYQLDDEYIINEIVEPITIKPSKTTLDDLAELKDKLNINIINENKPQNFNSNYSSNVQDTQNVQTAGYGHYARKGGVSKWLFIMVSIFLGGFGGSYFMLGRPWMGIVCLLFSWTYIPVIIGLVYAVMAVFKRPDYYGQIYFL